MRAPRPTECPACGHDRPRRAPSRRALGGPGDVPEEEWVCGLCRYQWTVALRPLIRQNGSAI